MQTLGFVAFVGSINLPYSGFFLESILVKHLTVRVEE